MRCWWVRVRARVKALPARKAFTSACVACCLWHEQYGRVSLSTHNGHFGCNEIPAFLCMVDLSIVDLQLQAYWAASVG